MRTDLIKTQISEECIGPWLPAKKLNQSNHLVLASALLQNRIPVASALLLIHCVSFERRIEHVHSINVRPEIAIKASIIAPKQMSICSVPVSAYISALKKLNWPIRTRDSPVIGALNPNQVDVVTVYLSDVHLPILCRSGVYCHVEKTHLQHP